MNVFKALAKSIISIVAIYTLWIIVDTISNYIGVETDCILSLLGLVGILTLFYYKCD